MLPKLVGTRRGQPRDGVQGCGDGKDSQWDVGKAVLLLHLGCCAAPLPSSPKQLLPEYTGCSAKAPRCRNWKVFGEQGRVLGSRHTSQHVGSPLGRRGEGREASARGQARGGPWRTRHALLETSGLGCGGVLWLHTHVCTSTWVWGNIHTHMCLWVHVYQYMYLHQCTCMLVCATYPHMCTCVPICAQTHKHRHEHLHTQGDTPRRVCAYGCKHIQLHVYTPLTT